ncbi:rhomboid-like protein 20 isoform X2 [Populus alba x Populus x berolinensis]|nr:rhomboid-like protein 20 isoform X2 [Populus alba x Populus x berolinensis]
MMFGLYLLYYFRVFERQIGSNKYLVFILFSVIVSLLFEVFAVALLKDPSANLPTSGPYGLIFASFVPFYFDIPVSTRFHIFSNHFSDKSFIYLAGVQLLLSSWKRSILPGICGILAGSLYRLNLFGIRKAKRTYPAPMAPSTEPTEDAIATLWAIHDDSLQHTT